jgi:hypothetical protein
MTKKSVDKQGSLYSITMNCKVNDGISDIFEADISARYNPNAPSLDDAKKEILDQLKEKWDKFKAERALFASAGLDSAIASIQAQAQTYVNL